MGQWSLDQAQRDETIARTVKSIQDMGFNKGLEISDEDARSAAVAFERKAYTAAQVASTTTTGDRPHSESTSAYARKMSEAVIALIKAGGKIQGEEAATTAGTAEEVNLTGSRDFLTHESTEQVLAALLAPGSLISKIKFSTKSFGRDAAAVAAKALRNVAAHLKHADISDVIAGRPEEEALETLRTLSAALTAAKLHSLNLSDNALGEKGVRACAEVLTKQPALQGLSLQNVGCSINACKAVAELLTQSQELRQLHLFNNMSDNEGAEHIASILSRAPLMADFRMASSRVGPKGGIALCQGLVAGRNLVKLDISDNPMTAKVAPALAALVQAQPNLKVLNINDTSLTDKGIRDVCLAVAQSSAPLEEIELALNEITPQGAKAVALALATKPTLRRVNLRENELEDKGAVVISKAICKLPELRSLDLCGNQMRRVGSVSVAKAVIVCTHMELLSLDENCISEAGLDEVREVLSAAHKSHVLGPVDDNMSEDDEDIEDSESDQDDDGGLSALMAKAGI